MYQGTNQQQPFFPDENVPSSEKQTSDWLMKYAKAAYYTSTALPRGSVGFVSRDKYREIKLYANARQTITKYKSITSLDQDPNNNNKVTDWSVRHAIPKYRRIALGLMEKEADKYNIRIDPIDSLAKEELEQRLLNVRAKLLVKESLMSMGETELAKNPVLQKDTPEEPDDLDGLSAMELGARHRTAMECEQLVEMVFNANDMKSVKKMRDQDLFDYGFAVLKDERISGRIAIRRCAPERMIMSYCYQPDFRDWKYVGELAKLSTAQLVAMSGGQITKDQLKFLWESGNLNTNSFTPTTLPMNYTFSDLWSKGMWTVLDLELRTTDKVEREENVDRRGNMRYGKSSKDPNKRAIRQQSGKYKYTERQIERIYKVKWVCGTDIVFDYGVLENQKRDKTDLSCAIGSYHMYASDLDDMRAYSRTEALIPYADDIQLASVKLQHALARVVPKGYAIDYAALESVAFTHQGQAFGVSDLLDMFLENGILLYNSAGLPGQNQRFSGAIADVSGGAGSEIQEYWTMITQATESIKGVLGLNDVTDASTPSSKMLVPVANYAMMATNNALSDLYFADRYLTQKLAKSVLIRAQDIIEDDKTDLLISTLGTGTLTVLKNINDIHKYIYSVSIEDAPSEIDLAQFNQKVDLALANNQLTIADVLQLNNIRNLKQKEIFLLYRVKKNLEQAKQEALANLQQTTNGQIQSAQAAEEEKRKTLQFEFELKMKALEIEHQFKMQQLQIVKEYDVEGKRIDATGRTEASFIQASGRDAENIRTNTTTLLKEGKGADVPKIDIPANLQSRVEPLTSQEKPELDFSFLK